MTASSHLAIAPLSKSKKRFFSLVVFLISWTLAETLGRVVMYNPLSLVVPSTNPRLIYELNPSYPGINSLGMRQAVIDLSTLHDRFVIAVIGDSHTFSLRSVNGAYAFPARLEHHLNAPAENKVTVLNLGVPGYNMVQELEVLQAKALQFRPDLVILQYCINDDHISNFIQPKYVSLNRLIHRSVLLTNGWTTTLYSDFGRRHLLSFVEERLPDLLLYAPGLVGTARSREQDPAHGPHPTRSKDLVPARYGDSIGRENLEVAVRKFGELCSRAAIPALATGFIEDRDKELYRASGFQVYSFFDMFEGRDMRRFGYDPRHTEGHFSDVGNEFIGTALAAYIQGHFPPRPHGRTTGKR
jgi:hypothetical protein